LIRGNAPETYNRRFANILIVNGLQYYYCSSRIQPDDTDTCGLHYMYYFKRRHRGMELPDFVRKVKRHPVTSATVARVRIDDERAGPDSHVGR
jgi:hypothetical protein